MSDSVTYSDDLSLMKKAPKSGSKPLTVSCGDDDQASDVNKFVINHNSTDNTPLFQTPERTGKTCREEGCGHDHQEHF